MSGNPTPATPTASDPALRAAFRAVDEEDWRRLDGFLGHSGHGKFWRAVIAEVRAALAPPPAQDPVPALGLPAGEVEGLRALSEKATPGPFSVSGVRTKLGGEPMLKIIGPDGRTWAYVPYSDRTPADHIASHADASLFAASTNLVRTYVLAPPASAIAPERPPAGWRCPECHCHSYTRVDEEKPGGSFGPGAIIRCVNCKQTYSWFSFSGDASPASAADGGISAEIALRSKDHQDATEALAPLVKNLGYDRATAELFAVQLKPVLQAIYERYRATTPPPVPPTRVGGLDRDVVPLALVMREHFQEGYLTDDSKLLVTAAMLRIWPEDRHTVETCDCVRDPDLDEDEPKCDECPTDAQWRAADAKLEAWLSERTEARAGLAPTPGETPGQDAVEALVREAFREGWKVNAIPECETAEAELSDTCHSALYLEGCENVDWERSTSRTALALLRSTHADTVGDGWQPIETAPKDGTIILASWLHERGAQTVQGAAWLRDSYGKYYWGVHGEHRRGWAHPTHWMPLPAAPTPLATDGGGK